MLVVLHPESLQDIYCILPLSDEEASISFPNLQAQKLMHHPKVFHLKLNLKVGLAVINQPLISCKKEIIYI